MPERQRMTTRLKTLFQQPALFVLEFDSKSPSEHKLTDIADKSGLTSTGKREPGGATSA